MLLLLCGYIVVVASTLSDAPRVTARGGAAERGVETFLYGLRKEDLQIDPEWDELPGSGWGKTVADAFSEAGYQLR